MSATDSPDRGDWLAECDQRLWKAIEMAKSENASSALVKELEDLQVHLVLARQVADRKTDGGAV
jgi:hypothetical protein